MWLFLPEWCAAEESAAAAAAEIEKQKAAEEAAKANEEQKTTLESALEMVKDLETKLSAKEDELTKLNEQFANITNKQTVSEQPPVKETAADVMKQLFNIDKKEE